MTLDADDLAVVCAIVRTELRRLLPDLLTEPERELLYAIAAVEGGSPFASSELLELSMLKLGNRPRLAEALAAVKATDSHKLGLKLRRIADRTFGAEVRLVALGKESNSRLWKVEGA